MVGVIGVAVSSAFYHYLAGSFTKGCQCPSMGSLAVDEYWNKRSLQVHDDDDVCRISRRCCNATTPLEEEVLMFSRLIPSWHRL